MRAPWGVPRALRRAAVGEVGETGETGEQLPARLPEPVPTSRVCRVCGRDLPVEEFSLAGHRRDGTPTRRTECRPCFNSMNAGKRDPRRAHDNHLRRTYGITIEEYEAQLAAQGGVCGICHGKPDGRRFHADHDHDHDHESGAVRGILCNGCNAGLGGFGDDPALLKTAIHYLRSHTKPNASNQPSAPDGAMQNG